MNTLLKSRRPPGRVWRAVGLLLLTGLLGLGAGQAAEPEPGALRHDARGTEQVWVPAGSFRMGLDEQARLDLLAQQPPAFVVQELPDEQPAHTVRLSAGYWLDRTEVTNAAFLAFAQAGGYADRRWWSPEGWAWRESRDLPDPDFVALAQAQPDLPRVNVTWYEAQAYARWRGGDLPTEAQWEYAARGPQSLAYPWGNTFDPARANVVGSQGLTPVGHSPDGASWVGALDLAGNAMEWVRDWRDAAYYARSPADDPSGPPNGSIKVEKGGWWGSNPFVARAAYRHFEDPPDYADGHIGFRVMTPGS